MYFLYVKSSASLYHGQLPSLRLTPIALIQDAAAKLQEASNIQNILFLAKKGSVECVKYIVFLSLLDEKECVSVQFL